MGRRKKRDFVMPSLDLDPETKKGIRIVLILTFGAISLLSLFDLGGLIGDYLKRYIIYLLGWGRWIFPIIMLSLGYLLYKKEKKGVKGATYLGIFLFILSVQSLFHFLIGQDNWTTALDEGTGGGYLGLFLAQIFLKLIGLWASLVLLLCLLLVSLMLMFNKPIGKLFGENSLAAKLFYPFNFILSKIFRKKEEEDVEEENEEENEEEEPEEEEDENEEREDEEEDEDDDKAQEFNTKAVPAFIERSKPKSGKVENIWHPVNAQIDFPIDMLSNKVGKSVAGDVRNNKEIIRQTLENFGIPVEMGDSETGPTVTRYTMKPADGIKLSRITELNSNLSLALAARSIRIEAPIPGKALVGVEVPNQSNAIVGLREILSSNYFKNRKSNMQLALGKDVSGGACIYDLVDTPHLLVAGATKSGKSVGINSIIMGLLYQNSPDDLRFIMVDPKRVELPIYNGIPHLLCPVITDVPKTINALKWCLNEMDRRLDIMGESHNKNIQTYNKTHKNSKMPYIVVIIDELADLMLLARKEIEGSLIRLLQMARAAGIHLILATQRPSADIITGLIKANMPARIAYAVNSGIDSRTILDEMGAEKLLGRGDMLFMTADTPRPKRAQGAFLSEHEIKKIVDHLKQHGEAQYIEGVTDKQKVGGVAGHGFDSGSNDESGGDDLFEEAKEIVINSGKASTSYLQRRLSIGYARAAKLIDLLENAGIVGPGNGSKPRELLITKEQYEAMMDQGISGVSLHNRDEAEIPESYLPEEEMEDEGEEREEMLEEVYSEDEEEIVEEDDENQENDDEPETSAETDASEKKAITKKKDKDIHDEDFDRLFSK